MHSRLPALLDHIRRWLDKPARAEGALDYTILPCTAEGRRLLLDVVLTPGRDRKVRLKAMRLLKRNRHGVELLLRTCEDPDRRRVLGEFYGPDHYNLTTISNYLPAQLDAWSLPLNLEDAKDPADPRPELLQLRTCWDITIHWSSLARGLDPSHWGHVRRQMLERGKTPAEADRVVQRAVEGTLAIARELSGRDDLSTPEEWGQWIRDDKPEPISLGAGSSACSLIPI